MGNCCKWQLILHRVAMLANMVYHRFKHLYQECNPIQQLRNRMILQISLKFGAMFGSRSRRSSYITANYCGIYSSYHLWWSDQYEDTVDLLIAAYYTLVLENPIHQGNIVWNWQVLSDDRCKLRLYQLGIVNERLEMNKNAILHNDNIHGISWWSININKGSSIKK